MSKYLNILFTKIIQTFWSRDISNKWNNSTKNYNKTLCIIVLLSCFECIFWDKCLKIRKEKILNYSQRFLNYIKCLDIDKRFEVSKCFSNSILYTLKALFIKDRLYFFF